MDSSNITFDLLSAEDVPRALKIENEGFSSLIYLRFMLTKREGYPSDEAGSLGVFQYDLRHPGCAAKTHA